MYFNVAISDLETLFGLTLPTFTLPNADPLSTGTMGLLFEDPVHNFERDTAATLQAAFDSATGGTLRLVIGEEPGGPVAESWVATGPADLSDLVGIDPGTQVGSFSFRETVLFQNFPGWIFDPTILGMNAGISVPTNDLFGVNDNADLVVTLRVPEPGSLLLLSAALLGLGFATRRRQR